METTMNCDELIPANIDIYSAEDQEKIRAYLSSFDESERKAYLLAKDHLGSSFHILRSNGFIAWQKNKEST